MSACEDYESANRLITNWHLCKNMTTLLPRSIRELKVNIAVLLDADFRHTSAHFVPSLVLGCFPIRRIVYALNSSSIVRSNLECPDVLKENLGFDDFFRYYLATPQLNDCDAQEVPL